MKISNPLKWPAGALGLVLPFALLTLAASAAPIKISDSALPSARLGQFYSEMVHGEGGRAPYRFQLAPGAALPDGMRLSADGSITGTPLAEGGRDFSLSIQDAEGNTSIRNLTLGVIAKEISITNETLPNGIVGSAYSVALVPAGGTPAYTFSLSSGVLPPGLSLSPAGAITGTPSTIGTFPIVVRLTDTAGGDLQKSYTILVGATSLAFTNITLPNGYIGQNYRANLQAAGGVQPWTFALTSGTLPNGLTLTPDGVISGIPTVAGQASLTFQVKDAVGATAVNTIALGISQSAITLAFTALPNATVGQAYVFMPTDVSVPGPLTYYVLNLPPGIKVTPLGVLTGVPTQAGTFFVRYGARDTSGAVVESNFPLTVLPAGFRFNTLTLPGAQIGQPYSQSLSSSGGSGAVTFALQSGALPVGTTLSTTGLLSGTPTTAGAYNFTVRATDAANTSTTATFVLIVSGPVVNFTTTSLPSATINQPYNQTLAVSGGAAPYTFVIPTGALPPGITLSATGQLLGMPTTAGTYAFTIRVTDGAGRSNTADFLIGVGAAGAPAITSILSAANYVGNGVSAGEIVVLFGSGIGPATLATFASTSTTIATTLAGTRVLFDGVAAPILYASATQLATIVPFNVAGKTSVRVAVEVQGTQSAILQVPVLAAKPALFTVNASGTGAGAILNQDSTLNSASNPAAPQSIVSIYVTGVGQTAPASLDGQIATGMAALVTPLTVTVNGQTAQILYAGNAPGLVAGLAQINLRLPAGAVSGQNAIQITSGSVSSSGTVTVFVR